MRMITFDGWRTSSLLPFARLAGWPEWTGCLVAAAIVLGIGGWQPGSVKPPLTAIHPPPPMELATPRGADFGSPAARPQKPPVFTFKPHKGEHRFHPIIVRAANRYEVDPALVKAIIKAESGYDARAVSKRGAIGLMQLMPATAEELGVEDGFNPEHNINGGVKYLKRLMDQFEGDVSLALAAYNAGSRKVKLYRGVPPFKTTRYYVEKVFRYYRFYKHQMAGETGSA